MKRVASFSAWALILSTLFLFAAPIPQAQAAACATPTQTSFTETGTAYTVQTFNTKTTNCTWAVPTGVTSLRIIIVGGGGGAGWGGCAGGGGAGRVLVSNNAFSVSSGSLLTLTVGDSGTGGFNSVAIGKNGESSSVTINGGTYVASGGGGGGGTSGGSPGLMGGSGGGGTVCGTARDGGIADTSIVSGFTGYANSGAKGNGTGGGGGGAGSAASDGSGGSGIYFWGDTFAGGGGGWGSGSGGSGGGGAAKAGQDTKANSGNPGTPGTGSGGGGGNDGGCGRIMIRYVVDATLSTPTLSGNPTKGLSLTITVTSTVAGRVRFYVSGARIPKCLSIATTGTSPNFSATCTWTPPNRGFITLKATFTPTDSNYSVVNTAESKVFVLNRTTKR